MPGLPGRTVRAVSIPYDLPAVPALNMIRRHGAPFTCPSCRDEGHVCEDHPDRFWGGLCCAGPVSGEVCEHGACHCGGAGMPCPDCAEPVIADGTTSITEAFVPRWKRGLTVLRTQAHPEAPSSSLPDGAYWIES